MDQELRRLITRLGQIGPQGFEQLPAWQLQALVNYGIKELSQRERLPFIEAKKTLDTLARVCDICNKSDFRCDCDLERCQFCGFGVCGFNLHRPCYFTSVADMLLDPRFPIPEGLTPQIINRYGRPLRVYSRCECCQKNWLCFRCNIAHDREKWDDWYQRKYAAAEQRFLRIVGPNWQDSHYIPEQADQIVICPQCYEEPLWWVKD